MTRKVSMLGAVLALVVAGTAGAQTAPGAPTVGAMAAPCDALPPMPPVVATYLRDSATARAAGKPGPVPSAADVKVYQDWQAQLLNKDFAGLCHYNAANAKLAPATTRRVVYFGDSITELWGMTSPSFFQNDVVNRGISGQTTQQMLVRFRADVIALRPRVVHIIAGTNDIAGNTGPTSLAWIEANIETMVDLAQANHIAVVLGTVPPAARFSWRPDVASVPNIAAYNGWLKAFAARKGIVLVDYFAAMDDGKGGIRPGLSSDGVHPTAAGYAIMQPLALGGIDSARRKKTP